MMREVAAASLLAMSVPVIAQVTDRTVLIEQAHGVARNVLPEAAARIAPAREALGMNERPLAVGGSLDAAMEAADRVQAWAQAMRAAGSLSVTLGVPTTSQRDDVATAALALLEEATVAGRALDEAVPAAQRPERAARDGEALDRAILEHEVVLPLTAARAAVTLAASLEASSPQSARTLAQYAERLAGSVDAMSEWSVVERALVRAWASAMIGGGGQDAALARSARERLDKNEAMRRATPDLVVEALLLEALAAARADDLPTAHALIDAAMQRAPFVVEGPDGKRTDWSLALLAADVRHRATRVARAPLAASLQAYEALLDREETTQPDALQRAAQVFAHVRRALPGNANTDRLPPIAAVAQADGALRSRRARAAFELIAPRLDALRDRRDAVAREGLYLAGAASAALDPASPDTLRALARFATAFPEDPRTDAVVAALEPHADAEEAAVRAIALAALRDAGRSASSRPYVDGLARTIAEASDRSAREEALERAVQDLTRTQGQRGWIAAAELALLAAQRAQSDDELRAHAAAARRLLEEISGEADASGIAARLLRARATVALHEGRARDAEATADALIRMGGADDAAGVLRDAHRLRALARFELGEDERALEDLLTARSYPADAGPLAQAFALMPKIDTAALAESRTLFPADHADPTRYKRTARWLSLALRSRRAVQEEHAADDARDVMDVAHALVRAGLSERALTLLAPMRASSGPASEAALLRAEALVGVGREAEAFAAYRAAAAAMDALQSRDDPRYWHAWARLCELLAANATTDERRRQLERTAARLLALPEADAFPEARGKIERARATSE
jgi:hypothetical protein